MRLIDADALKEKAFFHHEIDNVSYVEEEDIDKAPTVDAVERKRGRWDMRPDPDSEGEYGVCSECGHGADFGTFMQVYDFCPWCGADMRGENNGNNVRE